MQRGNAAAVEPVAVEAGDIRETVEPIDAAIEPRRQVLVRAQRSGRVQELRARLGDPVRAGEVVAMVADPVLEAEVREAAVAMRRSREALARLRSLYAEKVVPPAELEAAEFEYQAAEARMAALTAQQRQLSVRSPLSGRVTAEHVEPGEVLGVAAGGGLSATFPIVTVATVDQLIARVHIDEADAPKVGVGQAASITVPAVREAPIPGRVESVAPAPDTSFSGTAYEAVIALGQPVPGLLPGLRAEVRIVVQESRGVLRIPREAVFPCGASSCVFVLRGESVRRRKVETGIRDAVRVEVRTGLSTADTVVVGFPESLRDGDTVAPRRAPR